MTARMGWMAGMAGLLLAAGSAWAAGGPSFDCAKASTADEKLICASPALSEADVALAASYRALTGALENDTAARDRVKAEQRRWINQRNRYCAIDRSTQVTGQNREELTNCLKEQCKQRRVYLERLRDHLPLSVQLGPVEIKEENRKLKFELNVRYPEIQDLSVPGAKAFNAAMRTFIQPRVDGFRKELPAPADIADVEGASTLDIDYEPWFAGKNLITVQFLISEYAIGAAHGNYGYTSVHLDLGRGRTAGAADLLKGEGWIKVVADHALADLRRQAKAEDWELFDEAPKAIPEIVADLANWRFEDDQAVVNFDVYTVAAYAFGAHQVAVPYSLLKPYLRADGPLAGRI